MPKKNVEVGSSDEMAAQTVFALSVSPRYARKECLGDMCKGEVCEDGQDQSLEKGGEERKGAWLWNVKRWRALKSVVRGTR